MPLDGPAFGGIAARVRRFLGGNTPGTLVPVGGGTSIEFVHEREEHKTEATEDGKIINVSVLKVWVAERLVLGAKFTHNDWIWQVAMIQFDKAAGTDWPHLVELVGQARGPREVPHA